MDNEPKEIIEKPGRARRIIRYTVAISASVLLVFVLIEGYKFYSLSPDKLYSANYTAFELSSSLKSTDNISAIEKAYREKNYSEVINLNRNSVLTIKDVFLTAMVYLETKDYSRAISSLQIVITDLLKDKKPLKDTAEYYLALAYLKNNDYDQAIELMNAIQSNGSHPFHEKFSRKYINRVKRLKWR